MELNRFLRPIEIETDEDNIHSFLSVKEDEIRSYIISKYEEFVHSISQNNLNANSKANFDFSENDSVKESIQNSDIVAVSNQISNEQLKNDEINNLGVPLEISKKEKAENDAIEIQIKSKRVTLLNGKVNQDYCSFFNIDQLGIDEIGDFWFEGLEPLGLNYVKDTSEIKGLPTQPGEHKLKLKCKRKDWTEGKPIFEREIILIINPDPKSLWKNIPSDPSILYWKADSDKKFIKVQPKKSNFYSKKIARKDIVAASQRGRSHAHEGICRDDDFKVSYLCENDWYILIVADGAGSSKYSRKGSEIFCDIAYNSIEESLKEKNLDIEKSVRNFLKSGNVESKKVFGDIIYGIISSAVFSAYKRIEDEVNAEPGRVIKDYSTTLIISICKKIEDKWLIGAYWVGDGGIGIYHREKNSVKILGKPDEGEHAGQTRFITMKEVLKSETEWQNRLKIALEDEFTALILMTDGITDPKFQTEANLNRVEKWNELWNEISKEVELTDDNENSANQLLTWLDFWSPGNHDDRTIAILY